VGEQLTTKNVRHCVNSVSIDFSPAATSTTAVAYFAGGCFWGVEHFMQQAPGVISVRSGYMGGAVDHPGYKQVCEGTTGHAEAVEVAYDPTKTTYETLARLFFEIHDPTQVNRQGPDVGSQYRSAVFYANDDQRDVTERLIGLLGDNGYDVATQVVEAGEFWPAEDYHQNYYDRSGQIPYCHGPEKRF
jgi:peptide methionine sulfoxide reductase msrA/msrB